MYGDKYAGLWPAEQFAKRGIRYEASDRTASELYLELLAILNSGRVQLLDHKRCIAQLIGLERRTTRLGRDTVSHAPGGHDDIANAVAGAVVRALSGPVMTSGYAVFELARRRHEELKLRGLA